MTYYAMTGKDRDRLIEEVRITLTSKLITVNNAGTIAGGIVRSFERRYGMVHEIDMLGHKFRWPLASDEREAFAGASEDAYIYNGDNVTLIWDPGTGEMHEVFNEGETERRWLCGTADKRFAPGPSSVDGDP